MPRAPLILCFVFAVAGAGSAVAFVRSGASRPSSRLEPRSRSVQPWRTWNTLSCSAPLKGELQAQRVEREAERETLRGTVEALKAALEAERQLKGELRRELERLSRPWWRRLLAKAA
jgi:hypothetical protein